MQTQNCPNPPQAIPPFTIPSCWDTPPPPPTLDNIVWRINPLSEELLAEFEELLAEFEELLAEFKAELICSPTNPKQIFTGPPAD